MKRCHDINTRVAVALAIITVAWGAVSAQAGTVGYWRFEGDNGSFVADGTSVPTSGTPILDEIGSSDLVGTASGVTWQGDDAGDLFGATVLNPDPLDTSVNGTLNANGVNTRSLLFDNGDDDAHLSIPDTAVLDFSGALTVEGYFRVDAPAASNGVVFVNKRDLAAAGLGYKVWMDLASIVHFAVDNGPTFGRVGWNDTRLDDGVWHHFAGIRADDDSLHIWIDGVEDVTPKTNNATPSGDLSNNESFRIGGDGSGNGMVGYLDEIRVSDVALTSDQFLGTPSEPPPPPEGTRAYWRFEGDNGSSVADGTSVPTTGTPILDEVNGNHLVGYIGHINSPGAGEYIGATWQGDDTGELFDTAVPNPDPLDTDTNGTLNANGINTRSLFFDAAGFGDRIALIAGDNNTLDFSGAFTIEGSFRAAPDDFVNLILNKRIDVGYKVWLDSNGVLHFGVDTGPTFARVGFDDQVLDDDAWHHFAAIRDDNGDLHIWVDGVEDLTPATNGITTLIGDLSNGAPLLIGGDGTSLYPSMMDGYIDEIRLTGSALPLDALLFPTVPMVYLPGDANYDGFVNEADAAILAENWQTQGGATWLMGDFNADGNVDDIDATLLAANWGIVTAGNASVPEPGSLLLLASGLVGLLLFLNRRTR